MLFLYLVTADIWREKQLANFSYRKGNLTSEW